MDVDDLHSPFSPRGRIATFSISPKVRKNILIVFVHTRHISVRENLSIQFSDHGGVEIEKGTLSCFASASQTKYDRRWQPPRCAPNEKHI